MSWLLPPLRFMLIMSQEDCGRHILTNTNLFWMSCTLILPCTSLPTILSFYSHTIGNTGKIVLKSNMPFSQQDNSVKYCNSKKGSMLCTSIIWQIRTQRIKNKTFFLEKFRPVFIKISSQYFLEEHACNLFKSITYCDATVWLKADVFLVFNVQINPIYSSNHT